MSDWLYGDYLEVDQQFIDVYTEEADRQYSKAWKSYIPQEKTRQLLNYIADMLERKSRKPPFVFGPYGTGKTFTAFLIKHLLEDDLDEVASFFERYPSVKTLWPRWRALRERGPYLVVYRSSATDAGTAFRLVYIVQERITRALEEKGYSAVTDTLRQGVLRKLTDSESTFNWSRAFEKYRSRFKEFTSPDEVIARLRETSEAGREEGLLGLVERLVRTLEEEHFVVLYSIDHLKQWIKEVIERNRLQGLLFLWDEFTDFFRIPNSPEDLVQELAHLANEAPFYLGLITHQAPEIALRRMDDKSRAKFLERFERYHLELAEVTAYRLMGEVLRVKPDRAEEWERRRETLWSQVGREWLTLITMQGETKDDLRRVVPIHPYSAYILANIARTFSSSQRTLFRFLREERSGRFSFNRFLREYPHGGWYWLTADFLWDYFYSEDDPDYPEEVRRFISHYRANLEKIGDETDRRVYKAVLLLNLLHRRLPAAAESAFSFEPIRSRVQRVFEGVLSKDRVNSALHSLCERHLLQRYTVGQDEGYTLPLFGRDEKKVEELKQKIEKNNEFSTLVGNLGEFGTLLSKELELAAPLGLRQKLRLVAAREFLAKKEWVLQEDKLGPYQVGVVVVLPFDRNQAASAIELASRLSREAHRVVYTVAEQEFGEQRWEQWLEQKALAEYARNLGESKGEQAYQQRAGELVAEWIHEVITHGFHMFPPGGKDVVVAGKKGYEEFLEELVEKIYPLRPESLFPTGTLYTGSWGKQAAEVGLGLIPKPQNPYAEVVEKLKREGIWDTKDWPEEHPLARMRARLKEILHERGEINLSEAWELLMGPPYGLMPSRIGAMLFALLLRDYTEGYYYWDGNRCESLNAATLASLVEIVAKKAKGADNYSIRRMLPVEEETCSLLRELFNLSPENTRYLRSALIELREFLRRMGYPLWALGYTGDDRWPEEVVDGLRKLQQFMLTGPDRGNWQQEQLESLRNSLARLGSCLAGGLACQKIHYMEGMKRFLEQKNPDLWRMSERLGLSLDRLMEKLRDLLQEEVAFWSPEKVAQRLQQLRDECRLTLALNELMGTSAKELLPALEVLQGEWITHFGKLPLWLIAEAAKGEVKEALDLLTELCEAENFSPARDFSQLGNWAERVFLLERYKEDIRRVLREQESAFGPWLRKSLQLDASSEEISELVARLSQEQHVHRQRRREFEELVRCHFRDLERRRLKGELEHLWYELTGTSTPSQWSEQAGIPVHFLITDRDLREVLDAVDRPSDRGESQLRAALQKLQENSKAFRFLQDASWVKEEFLRQVVGDYAGLVESDEDLAVLKEFLFQKLGTDLSRWDLRRAQEAVAEWARKRYHQVGYHRVKAKLQELSSERIRALLESLAHDPRVGMLLLRELW